MSALYRHAEDESAMAALGEEFAAVLPTSLVIALTGDLGAGKTTLVRALLRALGCHGPVPSPTYTLLETYEVAGRRIHHLDLYRLAEPDELEFIGLRDLLADAAVLLVEWPQRGEGVLPTPDLVVTLSGAEPAGRWIAFEASSEHGLALTRALGHDPPSASL